MWTFKYVTLIIKGWPDTRVVFLSFYVLCLRVLTHSVGRHVSSPFSHEGPGWRSASWDSQLSFVLPWSPWDQSCLSREKESLDFSEDFHLPPAAFPPYMAEFEDFLFLPGPSPSRNWSSIWNHPHKVPSRVCYAVSQPLPLRDPDLQGAADISCMWKLSLKSAVLSLKIARILHSLG